MLKLKILFMQRIMKKNTIRKQDKLLMYQKLKPKICKKENPKYLKGANVIKKHFYKIKCSFELISL